MDMLQDKDNGNNETENSDITEEPVPKTNFCHLCMRKFDDYNEGFFDATLHYYNKMKEIKEKNNGN